MRSGPEAPGRADDARFAVAQAAPVAAQHELDAEVETDQPTTQAVAVA